MFSATEQRHVDQANHIRKKKWLSDLEMKDIKTEVEEGEYFKLMLMISLVVKHKLIESKKMKSQTWKNVMYNGRNEKHRR